MTTHTNDTTNSAGCSPCTPEAHQRSERLSVTFGSKEELYELGDAINEVVKRMLEEGQDELEIKYESLFF